MNGEHWVDRYADRVRRDVDLKPLTTVRIGGKAAWFVEPHDAADSAHLLRLLREDGRRVLFLGSGANLLVADGRLDAVVVHPSRLRSVEGFSDGVHVGAGVSLLGLVQETTARGLGGLEGLAGIPAQVGGAIAMNAGGRYGCIADVVRTVDLALPDGVVETVDASALRFGYRHAELPEGAMVVGARLALRPGDRAALKREAARILQEKNAAQPTGDWTFGCAFVNPEGESAGKLVEATGLKGLRRGGAQISPRHGNFIENLGDARAEDVLFLLEAMEREVFARTGVRLRREVRTWA